MRAEATRLEGRGLGSGVGVGVGPDAGEGVGPDMGSVEGVAGVGVRSLGLVM